MTGNVLFTLKKHVLANLGLESLRQYRDFVATFFVLQHSVHCHDVVATLFISQHSMQYRDVVAIFLSQCSVMS